MSYQTIGAEIGALVETKQKAYGDSFGKSGQVMRILYPEGIPSEKLDDALTVVRVLDKLFRIATDRDALGESPWRDIAGYALLAVKRQEAGRDDPADEEVAARNTGLLALSRLLPRNLGEVTQGKLDHAHRGRGNDLGHVPVQNLVRTEAPDDPPTSLPLARSSVGPRRRRAGLLVPRLPSVRKVGEVLAMSTRKPCPIQPCAERIPMKWVACEYHWAFAPAEIRTANRQAAKSGDVARVAWSALLAVCCIWSMLELASVPTPEGHTEVDAGCACPSCRTIGTRARRVLGISDELFDHLRAKARAA